MTSNSAGLPPIACALGPDELKARLARIAELNAAALQNWRSVDLKLELVYALEAEEQVREMVRYERECCAFLAFEVHKEQNGIKVIVQAPKAARDTAEFIFECLRSKVQTAAGLQCQAGYSK